jgi:hypothetical protein
MDWCGKAHVVRSTCEIDALAGLPSLLDGLLDGHIYRVVGWVQINQKLALAQTQLAPNELLESSRTSASECLFSEGQTQERRRFYNGSVKQRRAPRFTGEGRRYVTVIQTFIRKSDLTADQVTLDPSMEVSDY